jgi:hypothetical protein
LLRHGQSIADDEKQPPGRHPYHIHKIFKEPGESRMDANHEYGPNCSMPPNDAQGKSNLCCCYALDEAGRYIDPCDMPVEACCLYE